MTTVLPNPAVARKYSPLGKLGRVILVIFVANFFVTIAGLGGDFWLISITHNVIDQKPVAPNTADLCDLVNGLVGIIQGLLGLLGIILFLVWVFRAYRNLQILGSAKPRFTPGWVVGYFFIPILNFFRPYQALNEIWRSSRERFIASGSGVFHPPNVPAAIVGLWWAAYLGSGILNQASFRMSLHATTPSEVLAYSWVTAIADVGSLVEIPLTVLLVYYITKIQSATHLNIAGESDRRALPIAPESANQ